MRISHDMGASVSQLLLRSVLFFSATDAPCLPSAVRTDFGKCAIVRFFLAAADAFLIFFFAALLCFVEAIDAPSFDLQANLCHPVDHGRNSYLARAIGAAINLATTFDSLTNDPATAVCALGCERLNRTFETVKHVLRAIRFDAETLVVIIPASIALGNRALSFKTSSNIGNWMGNRREGLSSLPETTFQPTFSPDDFTFPN
jgi:hypothetical protein